MKLKLKYVALVDYDKPNIVRKEITNDLNEHIHELYKHISSSKKTQLFKETSKNTEVISAVLEVVNVIHFEKINEDTYKKLDIISERLRLEEEASQEKIKHMNKDVKKGSLIQAVFKHKDSDVYDFFLSKAEHNSFMEEIEYIIKEGFRVDGKNLWKSCIITCSISEHNEINIDRIKIYLDNKAVYWTKDFLELEKLRTDENNTRTAFREITDALSRELGKDNAKDYDVLKKSIYTYMKTEEQFDFENLVESKIKNYPFEELNEIKKDKLLKKLDELPELKKFDTQFNLNIDYVPLKDIKEVIHLTPDIELITKDVYSLDRIVSRKRKDGSGYIQIDIEDEKILNRFKK